MLSGEPPEEHGVLWNNVVSARTDVVKFPTVFSVAREHGFRTAAFFSKAKFEPLQRPGTLDYSQAPGGWFGRWSSARTIADVGSYLQRERPNFLFIHLSDPDRAGHSSGWMSDDYGRAVQQTDEALDDLVDAADAAYGKGNYSLLITADHGGHGRGHGTDDPLDVTIPWIAWGQGVNAGLLTDLPIQTFDTAPTVLWLLGVDRPNEWDGTPVTKAFHEPAALTTN
jgi:arylsulfatase A-like enzyme